MLISQLKEKMMRAVFSEEIKHIRREWSNIFKVWKGNNVKLKFDTSENIFQNQSLKEFTTSRFAVQCSQEMLREIFQKEKKW